MEGRKERLPSDDTNRSFWNVLTLMLSFAVHASCLPWRCPLFGETFSNTPLMWRCFHRSNADANHLPVNRETVAAPACSLCVFSACSLGLQPSWCFSLSSSYTRTHCGAGPVALVLWWPNVAQPISGNNGLILDLIMDSVLILSLKSCPFKNNCFT